MAQALWQPSPKKAQTSQMAQFMTYMNEQYDLDLNDYHLLHQFSIENRALFWQGVAQFCELIFHHPWQQTLVEGDRMQDCQWFTGATLNFAENLLTAVNQPELRKKAAIVSWTEDGVRNELSYEKLQDEVFRVAQYLQDLGVKSGDRVAGYLPNGQEAIVAMLATTWLGAVWSSCSPEFGVNAVIDRFSQIEPKVLFTVEAYHYNGKLIELTDKLEDIIRHLPTLDQVVWISYASLETPGIQLPHVSIYKQILKNTNPISEPATQVNFHSPLYILFSSGTTGKPKCIVHSVGGTLIQHQKELRLHTNLTANDTLFYYTTCGWMMWNWFVSGLATGATLITYDGSPFYPNHHRLLEMIDAENISIFGTSARYISQLQKEKIYPKNIYTFGSLHTILSTGSPLMAESYEYIYQHFKDDVCLSSISGGTDIISCFALGCPLLPVYPGELQCIGLGMDVAFFDAHSSEVVEEKGELICRRAFPSMPLGFWNDESGEKFQKAYFSTYPNVWAHGDYGLLTDRGSVSIYGRSDAVLNPGGVRIGTAEIYRQVEKIDEVIESVAIGHEVDDDVKILLFIKLKPNFQLSKGLVTRIKQVIREGASIRHVPAQIYAVPDIPRTMSGKTVELAVKKIIHQQPIDNLDAIANPESLEYFKVARLEQEACS